MLRGPLAAFPLSVSIEGSGLIKKEIEFHKNSHLHVTAVDVTIVTHAMTAAKLTDRQ